MSLLSAKRLGSSKILLTCDEAFTGPSTDHTKYDVHDTEGGTLGVTRAVAVLVTVSFGFFSFSVQKGVELQLGAPLTAGKTYLVKVDPAVNAAETHPLHPNPVSFQVVAAATRLSLRVSDFSGEFQGGLLGAPAGQVFFSPALQAANTGSTLQVSEVSCCLVAYDSYIFPVKADPAPLFLWSPGGTGGLLNHSVAWASPFLLNDFSCALGVLHEDTLGALDDDHLVAVLQETFDLTKVSLLNNVHWTMFDPGGQPGLTYPDATVIPGEVFKTADNSAPIGPGATVTITLLP